MDSNQYIEPISVKQQQQVSIAVDDCRNKASNAFGVAFPAIEVRFDLRGRAAGMYRVQPGKTPERHIRFNPWLFAKYFDDNLLNTVPHEVAHYVTDLLYGLSNIKPHGKQWREVMAIFGAEPLVRGNYDLTGIPVNRVKRFDYRCRCRVVQLSRYRHQQIVSGKQRYLCRQCGELLHPHT